MTGIGAGRGICANYRTTYRWSHTDRGNSEGNEHLSPMSSNL